MQGKAELVGDLLPLLQELYRDKLTAVGAHVAGSRSIPQYDINNTYQYIVNREEVQLTWLASAIIELGGAVPDDGPPQDRRAASKDRLGYRSIIGEDVRAAQAFVDKWRPRAEAMTHARHRKMIQVILGETLEQKRFFEQGLAGQFDLLGKRSEQVGVRIGEVMSTRWIE